MPGVYLSESAIAVVSLRSIYVVFNLCNAITDRRSNLIACFVEPPVRRQIGL